MSNTQSGLTASKKNNRTLIVHMLLNKRAYLIAFTLLASLLVLSLTTTDAPVSAQGGFPDPNANCPHATCGEVSPFVPMQSTEAVHMGLVWKRNSPTPKILFHARFPEYTPNDVSDPALVDLAISRGAFTTPGLQFNSSLRDVLHGFDPFLGLGTNRTADDSFQRLTYGGYLLRQGLSQSVPTRILANRTMERQLIFDLAHPDAFKNTGKFHTACLTRTISRLIERHSAKTATRKACSTTRTAMHV